MGYTFDNYQSFNRVIHRPSQKYHQAFDISVYTNKPKVCVYLSIVKTTVSLHKSISTNSIKFRD